MKTIKMGFALILLFGLLQYPAAAKNDFENNLPPGQQQRMTRSGEFPPGWQHKPYRKGDILDRQTCDQSVIVEPENKKGVIGIQVGDSLLRVIRSTREIVDVVEKK